MLRAVTPIQIGICSWADEGLVKRWYPRGVSSAEARLRYYAERFDCVEVDSPFYRLPAPETAAKWAERTPAGFVFHAKASGEMTGHRAAERDQAFAEFREALAPRESAGKLRFFDAIAHSVSELFQELAGALDLRDFVARTHSLSLMRSPKGVYSPPGTRIDLSCRPGRSSHTGFHDGSATKTGGGRTTYGR